VTVMAASLPMMRVLIQTVRINKEHLTSRSWDNIEDDSRTVSPFDMKMDA
jgi:hypothetical protein